MYFGNQTDLNEVTKNPEESLGIMIRARNLSVSHEPELMEYDRHCGDDLDHMSYRTGSVCDAGQMFAKSSAIATIEQLLF